MIDAAGGSAPLLQLPVKRIDGFACRCLLNTRRNGMNEALQSAKDHRHAKAPRDYRVFRVTLANRARMTKQ